MLISVLHQSKSNLATTGHIGSASDRFAQSTLDITKDKEKNTYVLSSRFMRSDSDFEPITLMNFQGIFQQVETEQVRTAPGKKATDLDEMESKRLLQQIVTIPMPYADISSEIIERTATSKAFAKISMRLVPNQDWENSTELFTKHFTSIAPAGVTVKVKPHHGGQGYVTPIDSIGYQAAAKAYADTFGVQPIPVRSGGSIPIVALFEKELKSKIIMMGFELVVKVSAGPAVLANSINAIAGRGHTEQMVP